MIFIDWLTISQTFTGTLTDSGEVVPSIPQVDSGAMIKASRNSDTQEINDEPDWISYSKVFHKGSFSSGIAVRSDGFRVDLSGNVGRFNRPDNLFNLRFDETIQKASELVALFGLPAFSTGEFQTNPNPSEYDLERGLLTVWTGATVSQVHLTENYCTGSEANARAAIDWLATQSKSHVKRGRAGESTMGWGRKGGRQYLKAYIKADEMLAHAKDHGRTREEVLNDPVYKFCRDNGVIRFELEAGRLLLRDAGLRYLGDITMEKLEAVFRAEVDPIINRVRPDICSFDIDSLDVPTGAKLALKLYLDGKNPRDSIPERTFYRYVKAIREYGFDISEPLPSSQVVTTVFRVLDFAPIHDAPSWYWDHQKNLGLNAANTPSFNNLQVA